MDLTAIPGEQQDFGTLDEALEDQLETISEELFKKGTLSSDSLDWETVQRESTGVLTRASHMLAFRGLILSLIERDGQGELKDAFDTGATLFSGHYPKLHPKSPKFQKKKASWVLEIIAALTKAIQSGPRQLDQSITAAGLAFCDATERHEFDVRALRQSLSEAPEHDSTSQSQSQLRAGALQEKGAPSEEPSKMDAKGRAQLRRDIQALAHKIFSNTPDAAISYEMRGFAGWMEFQFLPDADSGGKTELQPMPSAALEEHQRALSTPAIKNLQRLEERLLSNPDWFEGHRLASKLAEQLGLSTAAMAIRRRVADRLQSWPRLRDLKYSNDAPFVSDEIKVWLGEQHEQINPAPAGASDQDSEKESDILDVLRSIDAEIAAAKSPREKGLAKLRLLRAYKKLGHTAQARMMAEELSEAIKTAEAKDWDQHLLKVIEAELS